MRITYYANWTVTISSGHEVTHSYKKNNVQLKIKKYVKEKGEKETPEANAVFAVLDTSKITKKDLEKLTTQKARQEYVAGSKAVLGTITTDAKGEGTYTVTKDNGNKELTYGNTYTLLQTAGDSRYSLADAADVIINNTLSKREYAFSFVDTNACVLLKYKLDARTGEKTPEKGAEFEITQLSSGKKDDAAEATTATDTAAEGTTADASGETKGDTGETQPAFPMTVTTNEAGIVDLSILPTGTYKIHQTGGEKNYSYTDGKVYEGDSETATVSITRTDYSEGNGLSIKKNLVENPNKPDEKTAESGAIFMVIDAKGITGDKPATLREKLATLVTLNLRKEYVSSLEESQILGTITTDESGNGYLALDKEVGEFLVLQTEGRDGYSIADPVFSSDDAMKVETIKHGEQVNKMYSFTADDVKESKAKVSVMKQKKDDTTDAVAEQDATFQVLDVGTLYGSKGLNNCESIKR